MRKPQSIREEEEELGDPDLKKEGQETAAGVRDLPELDGGLQTIWDQDTFLRHDI